VYHVPPERKKGSQPTTHEFPAAWHSDSRFRVFDDSLLPITTPFNWHLLHSIYKNSPDSVPNYWFDRSNYAMIAQWNHSKNIVDLNTLYKPI
jgi:hypothetical protein